jgi:hypothetical protein
MNHVRRQFVTNGFLAVFALVSVAGVGAFLRWRQQSVPAQSAERLLPCLADGEPDWLSFAKGGREVRLVRRAGTTDSWFTQFPANSPGDSATIRGVISALRGMRVIRRIERASIGNLIALGLEPPRYIWYLGVGGSEFALSFGGQASDFRGGRYLMLSGPPNAAAFVYVVDANSAALDLTPEQVIDSRLVHANDNDVREIVFRSGKVTFHARKNQDVDHWFEVEQPRSRLENARIVQLLHEVRLLKGTHFARLPQLPPQGGQPWAALRLVLATREIAIEMTSPCAEATGLTTARVSGDETTVACADFSPLIAILSQEAETWRDTRLFTLRTDQVESVRTSLRGEKIDLRREGTAFTMGNANIVQVDLQAGNEFLTALLEARGQVVFANLQSVRPVFTSGDYLQIRSSVIGQQDEYQEKLFVGLPMTNGERFVKRAEDDAVLRISEATAELLQMDAQAFNRD